MNDAAGSPSSSPGSPPHALERLTRARALDKEIRALHERENEVHAALAQKMHDMDHTRGYLELGFGSLAAYAHSRLGWLSYKVRDLRKLLGRLQAMPIARQEFFEGRLDWTAAVEVARAAALAPGDEARLVAEAQARGTRGFKRWRAEQHGEPERVRVVLELDCEGEAWINEGHRSVLSEGKPMTRAEAVVELVRRAISGGRGGASGFRVFLNHDLDTGQTSLPTSTGEVTLRPELAERLLCDAELQDPSGKVTRTIPTKARNQIDARSLGICEVPRCGLRGYLENHHNRGWRAGHDVDDMLCMCAGHHDAVHKGSLQIRGSWRVGLTFCYADGTAWATLSPRPQSKRRGASASPGSEGAERAPLEDEAPAEEPVARATAVNESGEHAEDEGPTEEPVARATAVNEPGEHAEDEGPPEEPVARATPADRTGERAEARATVKRNRREDAHEVASGSTSGPARDEPREEERGLRMLEFTYREAKALARRESSLSWVQTPESSSAPRSGSLLPHA